MQSGLVIKNNIISCRGETFRPDYKEVPKIRSLLTKTPLLALTATATESMVDEIYDALHIKKTQTKLVGVVPDRLVYLISYLPIRNFFNKPDWKRFDLFRIYTVKGKAFNFL